MWILISIDDVLSINVVMVSTCKYIVENKMKMLEEANKNNVITYRIRQAEEFDIAFKG